MSAKKCCHCKKGFDGATNAKHCSVQCEFDANVSVAESGCWEWIGETNHGYGILKFRGKKERAHRASFRLHKGADPGSLLVCHTCDNKRCVNPKHLYIGTVQDNCNDAVARGLTKRNDDHHKSKLTPEAIDLIRATPNEYGSGVRLAQRFGVSPAAISYVRKGINWKHYKGS